MVHLNKHHCPKATKIITIILFTCYDEEQERQEGRGLSIVRSQMKKNIEIMINFTFLGKSNICGEVLSVITKGHLPENTQLLMIREIKWCKKYLISTTGRKRE